MEATEMVKAATDSSKVICNGKHSNGNDRLMVYLPKEAVDYLSLKKGDLVGYTMFKMDGVSSRNRQDAGKYGKANLIHTKSSVVPSAHLTEKPAEQLPVLTKPLPPKVAEPAQNKPILTPVQINKPIEPKAHNGVKIIQYRDELEEAEKDAIDKYLEAANEFQKNDIITKIKTQFGPKAEKLIEYAESLLKKSVPSTLAQ